MAEGSRVESLVSKRKVIELLGMEGIHPRKAMGQNFLVDGNILRIITTAANLSPDDVILEVGPGLGALTQVLVEECGLVFAVENDPRLVRVLGREFGDAENLVLVEEDAMKCDLEGLVAKRRGGAEVKMVANLPYNIAATLIVKCLQRYPRFTGYTVMVQQEVAGRILSGPGSRQYSAATVRICARAEVKKVTDVSRNCFYPKPRVDSTVIGIQRNKETPFRSEKEEERFELLVSAAFRQRRKKLANSVSSGIEGLSRGKICEALASLGRKPDVRAEELSPMEYVELSRLSVEVY